MFKIKSYLKLKSVNFGNQNHLKKEFNLKSKTTFYSAEIKRAIN